MEDCDDFLWVYFIGDEGVGKQTILRSLFEEHLECDVYRPRTDNILNCEGRRVKLFLMTISDLQNFCDFRDSDFKGCKLSDNAVCFVYDITDKNTFQRIMEIEQHLEQRYPLLLEKPTMKILLANKIDLHARRTISREEGQSFAQSIDATYFEVEAKSRSSVENVMRMILILEQSESKSHQENPGQYWLKAKSYGISPTLLKVLDSSQTTFSDILIHGMEENYQIRVMVVGNGGVGKTTLTRRLLHFPVNLREYYSTNGIDVHIHSCKVDLDTGEWVPKEKYSAKERLKYWFFGEKEKTRTAENSGDRDFHLRCAKALQKCQDLHKINLTPRMIGNNVPTGNANTDKTLSGCKTENKLEKHQDESQVTKLEERESDIFPADHQTSCTATSEPQHRLVTAKDLTEALQKAETLTAEQSSRNAKVSFYDFAGQNVFHASHPTFLSPSAIYILTFDLHRMLKKNSKRKVSAAVKEKMYGDCRGAVEVSDLESIIFWLNIIYMFAAVKFETHPHVILVGTHGDKIPKANRDAIVANFFREFRSAIAGSPLNAILSETEFIIDNSKTNVDAFSQLKTEIFELAKLQSSWGKKTPTKWLPLDREVQRLKESGRKVLALEELKTINRGLEVNITDDTEMETFLKFLHESGETVYYSDKLLRDNIVLDPVWLIDGLKTVITADRFAIRTPILDKQWKEFCESGIISRSAIVDIFEKNKEDPSLFENHEHVIRLMEKFLFIAAPVDVPDDLDANVEETEVHILDCFVYRKTFVISYLVWYAEKLTKNLKASLEGSSRTTIFCMVAENHFLPPAIFQKLLAMCITRWPIVEQRGRKLIFCGVCKFNLDKANHYKLTLFLVNYAVHARIESFVDKERPHQAVCQPVQKFLVHSLRSILQAMGLSAKFCQCIQCPQYSPTDSGGYLDISNIINQEAITCDKCEKSHLLNVQQLLGGWIDKKQDEIEPTGIPVGGCAGQEKMPVPDMEEIDVGGCAGQEKVPVPDMEEIDVGGCAGQEKVPVPDMEEIDVGGCAGQEKVPVPDMEEIDVGGCAGQEKVPVPDMEEIDADAPMTQQHINHARLCNVLVTVCADGLRDILLSQVPPGFATFYKALLASQPALTAMKQIRQEQFDLLFPDPNGRYTGALDQFDITLLYALIRNISSVQPPVTGWGRQPADQPRDTTISANVERIRIYRNNVNGHSADGRLEDPIFEDYWDKIIAVMDDIENSIGPKGYRIALEKRKNQVLTSKDAQRLQLKLREIEEKHKNLAEVNDDILATLQAIVKKYKYD